MEKDLEEIQEIEPVIITEKKMKYQARAMIAEANAGGVYYPTSLDQSYQALGLTPEKLIVPKDYRGVVRMSYDFYQRGGSASRVIDRMQEFTVTEIRNGQRKTTDEQNNYFEAILHNKPSRLLRHLRVMALEYYLAGMVLPKIDWIEMLGKDLSHKLIPSKKYMVPIFDNYPPLLVEVRWVNWGQKGFFLKVPDSDIKAIRSRGGRIKEQQTKYKWWMENFPAFVQDIQNGTNEFEIKDSDPILRKEISITPYPTPYLYNVLEALVYKQQLRRMDFAVASRVISAILLVKEGNDMFPLTEETQGLLDNIQNQLLARTGDPRKIERLFILFTDHTTTMEWITPDVEALLNQDKYRQVNEELDEGLGFPGVLLTGTVRQGGQTSEISTWAIQSQMEELRSMFLEWIREEVYVPASELNNFRNIPEPTFKPIKLQDMIKTAAVYQQLFVEGNVSRTTRNDMAGLDFETEAELMKDEQEIAKDLPAYTPTPYSPPPPLIGTPTAGRPIGSQNVPVNNRNSGVKPRGQKPTSKVKAEIKEVSDEELLEMINTYAKRRNLSITLNDL
jgi:hypothetical protein